MSESTIELDLHNPQQWAVVLEARLQPFVKSWLTAGKKLTLTCKLQKRSTKQNRRYWGNGILAQIAAQAVVNGKLYSAETWHEQFKRQILGFIELPGGGVIGKSTTGLTTAEFCEFSDQVEAYAQTELGVHFVDLPVKDLR
jgi:NinB protein